MQTSSREPPPTYSIAQEIDWDAPFVEAVLRVELPFWLMTDNATIPIELNGHTFPVVISGETFELHGVEVSDAKRNAVYQGPLKAKEELSLGIQQALKKNPDINILWRKCKTVLRITSRCNEDVLHRYFSAGPTDETERPAVQRSLSFYLQELCRTHIPIVNTLINAYRLATYDYFPYEIAPWDVPIWYIERAAQIRRCLLVPYRGWDHRPLVYESDANSHSYKLIEPNELQGAISAQGTQGELELLDALNLMERGDYSGAVRRVCTAIEVVVEVAVASAIETAEGKTTAEKFLKATRMNFAARIKRYEALSGRAFMLGGALKDIRDLRNRIVHNGYRIRSSERGEAQHKVDTGRWIFNWFEDDECRRKVRESRIGFRSLGRDITYGMFRGEIAPEGVIVRP